MQSRSFLSQFFAGDEAGFFVLSTKDNYFILPFLSHIFSKNYVYSGVYYWLQRSTICGVPVPDDRKAGAPFAIVLFCFMLEFTNIFSKRVEVILQKV